MKLNEIRYTISLPESASYPAPLPVTRFHLNRAIPLERSTARIDLAKRFKQGRKIKYKNEWMKKGTREWEISLKNTRLEASSVASPPCCRIVELLFANFKRYRIRFRFNVCFAATKIQHFAFNLACDYPVNKLTIVSYSFIRRHLPVVFPCCFNRDKHFRLRFVSKI